MKEYNYNGPVPQDVLAKYGKGKRPTDEPAPGEKPPKSQKGDSSGDVHARKRADENDVEVTDTESERLEFVEGRLSLRNDKLNTTRPLTPEELAQRVEVVRCKNQNCARERAALKDGEQDNVVVIPGVLPSKPMANTAIPTMVTSVMPEKIRLARLLASVQLSAATAVAMASAG